MTVGSSQKVVFDYSHIDKAKLWAEIALDDLKTSKYLYVNGYYRYAIYTLQQAVEKGYKSMWISLDNTGEVTNDKLRSVSHDTLNHFYEQFFGYDDNPTLKVEHEKIKKISEKHPTDLTDDDCYKAVEQIIAHTVNPNHPKLRDVRDRLKKDREASWLKLQQYAKEKYGDKPEVIKAFQDPVFQSNYINSFVDAIMKIHYLYNIMALTQNHVSITRYPDDKVNPLEFYNSDNLIIKDYWILYESALSAISLFYNHYKTFVKIISLLYPDSYPVKKRITSHMPKKHNPEEPVNMDKASDEETELMFKLLDLS